MTRSANLCPWILIITLLSLLSTGSALAQPVGTVNVEFSNDGGTTFTDDITVDDMTNFLMRIHFDNTGDAQATASSIAATLPAGFALVAGTTTVCVEPSPGEILCNTDASQSGAIDEASVWSGQDLTISPTAGLFGQGVGLTSGALEFGKKRYINLHDCHYFNGVERFFTTADPDISGTNTSNTIDAAAACAGVVGAYGLAGTELRTADLLANRYVNYHECHYNFLTDHIIKVADGTATRASNTVDAAFNCAGTAGAHILHPDSAVTNFDVFGNRYLNLWECRVISGGDLISLNSLFGIGSNASNTADAAPSCPATVGAYTLNDSDIISLDLLDSTRGGGFVQVEVRAQSGGGMFDIDTSLAAAEFATEMDTGTVTVEAEEIPEPIPTVDLKYSQSCDLDFADMAMPYPGEVFTARIYYENIGSAGATGASISTTLPAGYTLVADTTRVCRETSAGVTVCNDDPDQGGPINEAAVWSGQTLTIAPMAGINSEPTDAASGVLDIGRKRYLNVHECHYYNGISDRLFLNVDQGQTGTNVSDTMDTTPICGAAAHGGTLVGGRVSTFDLHTGRYLNLHECQYHFFFTDRIFLAGNDYAGTNIGTIVDSVLSCAPIAGSHKLLAAESNIMSLDLAGKRYLNLHECVLQNLGDHIGITAGGSNGTNASDEADDLVECPSSSGAHTLVTGSVASMDMLDASRGGGYVEFQVTAGDVTGTFDQTADFAGNEFTTVSDTEQIMAAAGILFKNGFECGDTNMWSMVEITP